ncbi:sugar transporter [Dichomitus squalens]|uniref:Sugar transporter n=1 Tax=Dichomitus squalens TaxID=114155 RepID=A0A4Q9Q912_9APHY|nr:sugar transporter [Dichomitus squalens LYAD-421 SS1]EJF62792.1 sugar transporter [Dichomitus squalens LYAD-421 SS1]TBU48994.1 sugar transporter [Dichomitus squalens]TBU64087.1 sugar transporter [Dichomitus squalens]
MSSSKSASLIDVTVTSVVGHDLTSEDGGTEYGGHEARRRLERRLVRKIDLRMSILVILFILNIMDRTNIAAARQRGLETDLGLQGQEYATLLSILYVGFMIMQVPSNMFLNRLGKPSIYLPTAMALWGVINILTGITKDFVGALLARFFLGFVEAAFFPGTLFLLSKWYKRGELGGRIALMFYGIFISNAFGALVASGILDGMDGKLGQAAWRWLFYIDGSLTILVALCAMFILPDFPSTTTWLSEEERSLAMRRMEEDAGVGDEDETEEGGHLAGLQQALRDWKVWWLALLITNYNISLSCMAYFPTLSATMGFKPTVTLLLCTPPFVITLIVAFAVSRHSDKTGERFHHITVPIFGGIVGSVIAICTMNTAARYVSLFLMAQSCAGYAVLFTWVSNSFPRPPSKRAVALALVNAFSQLGGIAGSYVWPSAWGPTYRKSYAICISTAGCMIVMCYVFKLHLARLNRELDGEEAEKGVKERGFRYLL